MEGCEARRRCCVQATAGDFVMEMIAGVFFVGGTDKELHPPNVCMLL